MKEILVLFVSFIGVYFFMGGALFFVGMFIGLSEFTVLSFEFKKLLIFLLINAGLSIFYLLFMAWPDLKIIKKKKKNRCLGRVK